MRLTSRRIFATAATAALVLTGAACSDDTEGTPTASSAASDTGSESTESSETSDAEESEESEETSTSSSDKPEGSMEASDGSFTFDPPAGYQDGSSMVNVPGALFAVYDPSSDSSFPTHIVANSSPDGGLSLEAAVEAVRDEIEKKYSTTTTNDGQLGAALPDIDGEDYVVWSTDAYKDGAQDVASAQIVTRHDGKLYFITVNTLPGTESAAGNALVELANSIKWS